MTSKQHPVIICGGGLAGLTAAVMLTWRGVRPLLVEQHAGPLRNPRARSVNVRSMELLRVAGLQPDLMAAVGASMSEFGIVIAESVTGRVLKTLLPQGSFDTSAISPAPMSGAGQDRIEAILAHHAHVLGADIRYGTQLQSFEQDGEGVNAVIRDLASGETSEVCSSYLIAADGNRSPVRQRLGIGVQGHGVLSQNIGIVFEADLQAALGERASWLYFLQSAEFHGAFIAGDVPGRALVTVEYDPRVSSAADFDTARCVQLVRAALGVPDIAINILEVTPWTMSSWVADRFQAGRVLLAGDAAHTMPPTGGLGGQTAMQDGYDLAWKLALVLQGQADAGLLATYEEERRHAAQLTVALQTANYAARIRPDRQQELRTGVRPEEDYLAIAAGCRYRSAAISPDGPDDGARAESPLHPTGTPGTRAAHVVLEHRGARISSIDLIGRDFVLMCGPEGAAWAQAATALRYSQGLPLSIYRIGADLLDVEGTWARRLGVSASGAVLLRPDGYIAWRSSTLQRAPGEALRGALARALCRPGQWAGFGASGQAA